MKEKIGSVITPAWRNNQGCHKYKMAAPFSVLHVTHLIFPQKTNIPGFTKAYWSFSNADKGSWVFSMHKQHR